MSVIADRFCVTSAALAEANDWGDGVDHLIRPGDAIALPADACEPVMRADTAATNRPATTRPASAATAAVAVAGPTTTVREGAVAGPTTTVNQYIEGYRFDGGVSVIPMLGDPELYEGDDTLCDDAYYGVMDFNRGLADVADLEADLSAIDVTPTADQRRYLQAWQEWKNQYLDGYQAVLDEISAADLSDAATIEPLLADPRYVEASDAAYVIVGPAESVYSSVVAACS